MQENEYGGLNLDASILDKDLGVDLIQEQAAPPAPPTENIPPPPTEQAQQASQGILGAATKPITNALKGAHNVITGGQKWNDLQAWRQLPPGQEQDQAKEAWFQRYYGGSSQDFQDMNALEKLGADLKNQDLTSTSWASATAMGLLDIPMDLVGLLPGGDKIDEGWDDATAFRSPLLQSIRKLSTVVIPTLVGGKAIGTKLAPINSSKDVPWIAKSLANVGAYGALDAAILGLTDVGEDDSAARALVDFFPDVFGPDGSIPLPDFLITLDSDSPSVRKQKNMYEAAGLSVATDILGYWLSAGKPTLKWFKPLDSAASEYKQLEISTYADNKALTDIQELNQLLLDTEGKLSKVDKNILLARREELIRDAESIGNFEKYTKNNYISKSNQNDAAALRKLDADPENTVLDADINPHFVTEASSARQSIPPGNIARNAVDTTAIKNGDVVGTPAPVVSETMTNKVFRAGGNSRDVVVEVAEAARDSGKWQGWVDGLGYSQKEMGNAAWKIYRSIIYADNLDEVKNIFLNNNQARRLAENVFDTIQGGEQLADIVAKDQATGGALFALKDLVDRYIGRGIMQSSARVMDTLGREISDIAQASRELVPSIDENRAMHLMLDKIELLMSEVGINKYVASWQLKQYDRWYNLINSADDPGEVLDVIKSEFLEVENLVANKARSFTQELKQLQETNPLALRPLVAQFERSNGDVDTLQKLMAWARDEVTPLGMAVSPNPTKINKFAQGAWAVGFNNVLSGLAAGRAILGNTYGIISKPIVAMQGGTLEGLLKGGDFSNLRRSMYYFGGVAETNRRLVKESWTAMKKVWKNPDALIDSARKDLVVADSLDWDSLDQVREIWAEEKNWGRILQLDLAKMNYDLSRWAPMRIGMTVLQGADAGLNAVMATYVSRVRAYDEVFTKAGKTDFTELLKAEEKHYKKLFDKTGVLSDEATKVIAGETALNLKDDLSDTIGKFITRYPFLRTVALFPRTLSNNLKLNLSWTPIASIPGLTKYGDVIWAKSDEDIAKALRRHGIDASRTPAAQTIFENLRTEYRGRVAFSGMLVGSMWSYAMAGNIRGNGSYEPSKRRVDRDQFGFVEKTIKIGDKWVSFKGIPMVDPMLTMLGDLSYYARDFDHAIIDDVLDKLVWTVSATFLNETVLTGLEPFVAFLNQDVSWFSRYAANTTRMFLPMSGAAGVLANAIDSTQKDIHGNIIHYIMNRTPVASLGLPKQVDVWTGGYLNDIENPVLRIINALSPVKVSGTDEPWRKELRDSGYDGLSMLKTSSDGSYEYTASEREELNKLIGKQQIYKEVIKILRNPKHQEQLKKLRSYRASGKELNYDRVDLDGNKLDVFIAIDQVVRRAQKVAELEMYADRPDILETIHDQKLINQYLRQGDVDSAIDVADKNQEMVENLINLPK